MEQKSFDFVFKTVIQDNNAKVSGGEMGYKKAVREERE